MVTTEFYNNTTTTIELSKKNMAAYYPMAILKHRESHFVNLGPHGTFQEFFVEVKEEGVTNPQGIGANRVDSDECLSISKVTIQGEAGKITLEKKMRGSNGGRKEETIEEEDPTPNITSTPTKSLKGKKTKQFSCKVM
ncbi:unnamed protein product [Sphagnum jensenii]|uniref:DUF7748 domain-containing protein n=1 Tax=Sphagnum jensenii TaxID=128206 RepID=A0ABP1BH68_9BRYO